MAEWQKSYTFTDQGPKRSASFTFTTTESDLLALATESILEGRKEEFRPSELITLSRVKAVLDAASDWVEGHSPLPEPDHHFDNWEN
jgi:hypothetical protein